MKDQSPAAQFAGFLAKFTPQIGSFTKQVLVKLRRLLPGAVELVYDNYNALVVGFGPTERASDAIFSIAIYPRWINLFFLQEGPRLPDPQGLLKGNGKLVRHIVLESASDLDHPGVQLLIAEALARTKKPLDGEGGRRMVIKSISARQRPRRPA